MSKANPHPNDTHPNSEALNRAFDEGPASVRAVIAQDPKVLAYPLSYETRFVYPLRAALGRYYEIGGVVLEALREHEKIIREEFAHRGAEKDLLHGNVLYALSPDPRGPGLPHEGHEMYAGDYLDVPMLYDHGYDFTLHSPRSNPMLHQAACAFGDRLESSEGIENFLDRFEAEDLSPLNRRYYVDCAIFPSVINSVPIEVYDYFRTHTRGRVAHGHVRNNLLAMAQKGIDLRPVMEQNLCGREVQDYLRKAEMSARAANKDEGLSLRLSCATGMLPAVLSRLAGRGDEAGMARVVKGIGDYWREEYRHSIRRAETVVARKLPVEESALKEWVGR